MSIRISEGGRLFGIVATLGGAVMICGAALTWTKAVLITHDYSRYDVSEPHGADRTAILVLGLSVVAGAARFIVLASRRMRMTAGAFLVFAAAAGLAFALLADSLSFAGSPVGHPCQPVFRLPCISTSEGDGRVLAGLGAGFAAGFGIVALIRSGGEAPTGAARRLPSASSGETTSGDFARTHKRRMSDAALLGLILIAMVIALVVGFNVVVQQICSESGSWC